MLKRYWHSLILTLAALTFTGCAPKAAAPAADAPAECPAEEVKPST